MRNTAVSSLEDMLTDSDTQQQRRLSAQHTPLSATCPAATAGCLKLATTKLVPEEIRRPYSTGGAIDTTVPARAPLLLPQPARSASLQPCDDSRRGTSSSIPRVLLWSSQLLVPSSCRAELTDKGTSAQRGVHAQQQQQQQQQPHNDVKSSQRSGSLSSLHAPAKCTKTEGDIDDFYAMPAVLLPATTTRHQRVSSALVHSHTSSSSAKNPGAAAAASRSVTQAPASQQRPTPATSFLLPQTDLSTSSASVNHALGGTNAPAAAATATVASNSHSINKKKKGTAVDEMITTAAAAAAVKAHKNGRGHKKMVDVPLTQQRGQHGVTEWIGILGAIYEPEVNLDAAEHRNHHLDTSRRQPTYVWTGQQFQHSIARAMLAKDAERVEKLLHVYGQLKARNEQEKHPGLGQLESDAAETVLPGILLVDDDDDDEEGTGGQTTEGGPLAASTTKRDSNPLAEARTKQRLLDRVLDPETGYTLMHLAVLTRKMAIIHECLLFGSRSHAVEDAQGDTPLTLAMRRYPKAVNVLFTAGRQVDVRRNLVKRERSAYASLCRASPSTARMFSESLPSANAIRFNSITSGDRAHGGLEAVCCFNGLEQNLIHCAVTADEATPPWPGRLSFIQMLVERYKVPPAKEDMFGLTPALWAREHERFIGTTETRAIVSYLKKAARREADCAGTRRQQFLRGCGVLLSDGEEGDEDEYEEEAAVTSRGPTTTVASRTTTKGRAWGKENVPTPTGIGANPLQTDTTRAFYARGESGSQRHVEAREASPMTLKPSLPNTSDCNWNSLCQSLPLQHDPQQDGRDSLMITPMYSLPACFVNTSIVAADAPLHSSSRMQPSPSIPAAKSTHTGAVNCVPAHVTFINDDDDDDAAGTKESDMPATTRKMGGPVVIDASRTIATTADTASTLRKRGSSRSNATAKSCEMLDPSLAYLSLAEKLESDNTCEQVDGGKEWEPAPRAPSILQSIHRLQDDYGSGGDAAEAAQNRFPSPSPRAPRRRYGSPDLTTLPRFVPAASPSQPRTRRGNQQSSVEGVVVRIASASQSLRTSQSPAARAFASSVSPRPPTTTTSTAAANTVSPRDGGGRRGNKKRGTIKLKKRTRAAGTIPQLRLGETQIDRVRRVLQGPYARVMCLLALLPVHVLCHGLDPSVEWYHTLRFGLWCRSLNMIGACWASSAFFMGMVHLICLLCGLALGAAFFVVVVGQFVGNVLLQLPSCGAQSTLEKSFLRYHLGLYHSTFYDARQRALVFLLPVGMIAGLYCGACVYNAVLRGQWSGQTSWAIIQPELSMGSLHYKDSALVLWAVVLALDWCVLLYVADVMYQQGALAAYLPHYSFDHFADWVDVRLYPWLRRHRLLLPLQVKLRSSAASLAGGMKNDETTRGVHGHSSSAAAAAAPFEEVSGREQDQYQSCQSVTSNADAEVALTCGGGCATSWLGKRLAKWFYVNPSVTMEDFRLYLFWGLLGLGWGLIALCFGIAAVATDHDSVSLTGVGADTSSPPSVRAGMCIFFSSCALLLLCCIALQEWTWPTLQPHLHLALPGFSFTATHHAWLLLLLLWGIATCDMRSLIENCRLIFAYAGVGSKTGAVFAMFPAFIGLFLLLGGVLTTSLRLRRSASAKAAPTDERWSQDPRTRNGRHASSTARAKGKGWGDEGGHDDVVDDDVDVIHICGCTFKGSNLLWRCWRRWACGEHMHSLPVPGVFGLLQYGSPELPQWQVLREEEEEGDTDSSPSHGHSDSHRIVDEQGNHAMLAKAEAKRRKAKTIREAARRKNAAVLELVDLLEQHELLFLISDRVYRDAGSSGGGGDDGNDVDGGMHRLADSTSSLSSSECNEGMAKENADGGSPTASAAVTTSFPSASNITAAEKTKRRWTANMRAAVRRRRRQCQRARLESHLEFVTFAGESNAQRRRRFSYRQREQEYMRVLSNAA